MKKTLLFLAAVLVLVLTASCTLDLTGNKGKITFEISGLYGGSSTDEFSLYLDGDEVASFTYAQLQDGYTVSVPAGSYYCQVKIQSRDCGLQVDGNGFSKLTVQSGKTIVLSISTPV